MNIISGKQYTQTTQSILCTSYALDTAVPLTPTPVADDFVPPEQKDEVQPVFPLDLLLCHDWGDLQLNAVVDTDFLFRDYLYVTKSSLGLVEHFRELATQLVERHG